MTRHKEKLDIYANTEMHSSLDALTRTLSRTTTKDNVIDWPLDFVLRAGFDSDGLIGKAIHYIAKAATTIKDKWNYVVNYEAFLLSQDAKTRLETRVLARSVAALIDESHEIKKQTRKIEKEANEKNIRGNQHPEFQKLYQRSLERDQKAAALILEASENLKKMTKLPHVFELIKIYSTRYERYQTIEKIAASFREPNHSLLKTGNISNIDIKKDTSHIGDIASKFHLTDKVLREKIGSLQKESKKRAWLKLCQEYPLLVEYEKEAEKAHKAQGYYKEICQKSMQAITARIIKDSSLLKRLKQEYPNISNVILAKNKCHFTFDIE